MQLDDGGHVLKYRSYRHNVVERDVIEGGFHKDSQEHQQWDTNSNSSLSVKSSAETTTAAMSATSRATC